MNGDKKDLARYRLERAYETLEEARIMAESNHWNTCVNRLYYACFYAVSALLVLHNLSSSRHSGVRALFNREFVNTGQFPNELAGFYNKLFELRQQSDYEDYYEAHPDEAHAWLPKAEQFIGEVAALTGLH